MDRCLSSQERAIETSSLRNHTMTSSASASGDPFQVTKYVPAIQLDDGESSEDDTLGPRQFAPSKKKFSLSDFGLGKGKKRKRQRQREPQPSLQKQDQVDPEQAKQNADSESDEKKPAAVPKQTLSERKRKRENDPAWIEQQGTCNVIRRFLQCS